jgi:hypothetical protein
LRRAIAGNLSAQTLPVYAERLALRHLKRCGVEIGDNVQWPAVQSGKHPQRGPYDGRARPIAADGAYGRGSVPGDAVQHELGAGFQPASRTPRLDYLVGSGYLRIRA